MSTLAESSVPSNEPAATPAEAVYDPTQKQKSQAKTARIPIKIIPAERLKKPEWIRVKAAQPGSRFYDMTIPERCYRDAAAAEADGMRAPKR